VNQKLFLSVAIGVFCLHSAYAFSESIGAETKPFMSASSAKVIVENYKNLRQQCAASEGLARKQCFSELKAAGDQYSVAKKLLPAAQTNTRDSIHYVSFTQ